MKTTLRKVEKGIVSIIDERPKAGEWSYNSDSNHYYKAPFDLSSTYNHKILASTFGIGLELCTMVKLNKKTIIGFTLNDRLNNALLNKEYKYSLEDDRLIIKL